LNRIWWFYVTKQELGEFRVAETWLVVLHSCVLSLRFLKLRWDFVTVQQIVDSNRREQFVLFCDYVRPCLYCSVVVPNTNTGCFSLTDLKSDYSKF
jgi:hypothetical protein